MALMAIIVTSASFIAVGVLECNLSNLRSVAALCMLFRIQSNVIIHLTAVHCFCRMIRCVLLVVSLVAHRHSFAPPRCKTSQYQGIFVSLSASLWNDFNDSVFNGVRLVDFKSSANASICSICMSPTIFSFSSFHGLVEWG